MTFKFDSLRFDNSNNLCTSLRILAEKARTSDVRKESVEFLEGDVRDYLTITVSLQKVGSNGL